MAENSKYMSENSKLLYLLEKFRWSENIWRNGSFSEVKGQGQTLNTLKSNISKTVRDRGKVSMEVR